MNQNLKENERELVKLVNYFRKRAERLFEEGKLSEEHQKVTEACQNLITKMETHANVRSEIMKRREELKNIVKDNAQCPQCHKNTHLKMIGTITHEKGWKSNKYKCRRCNIEFVWNRPNNPWDMLPFIDQMIQEVKLNAEKEAGNPEIGGQSEMMLAQLNENLAKLKPIIENSDKDFEEIERTDVEMGKMIKDFKNYLLIEKVKMDAMED